jgi:hypothetical protein
VSVPENYRLVIKTVTAVNNTGAAAQFLMRVHGYYVMSDLLPAASSKVYTGLQIVCYERETIQLYFYATSGGMSVHGYLFKDDQPRIEFPPALVERPAPMPVDELGGHVR